MDVNDLRRAIAELPGAMPVLIAGECGAGDSPNLYLIPAHIEHSPYRSHVYEDHRNPPEWAARMDAEYGRSTENCTALLLSEWGNDRGEDITPRHDRHDIIEGEIIVHRSELIPGGNGARIGTSDDHPGLQFLVIPQDLG